MAYLAPVALEPGPARTVPRQRSTTAGWIAEIDGLRAIASLLVVLAHFNPASQVTKSPLLAALQSVSPGNLAVVFFFSLSSFLLTYLSVREFDRTGRIDVGGFYLRRIFRIWPLYFTMLGIMIWSLAPFGPLAPNHTRSPSSWAQISLTWWTYFLFISNWNILDWMWSDLAIFWTIQVEEQFYLFFPMLVLLILRSRVLSWALPVCIILVAYWWRESARLILDPETLAYYMTPTYLDIFCFGGLAGWLAARQLPRWQKERPRVVACLREPLMLAALLFVVLAIGFVGDVTRFNIWFAPSVKPYGLPIYVLLGPAFALILIWTYFYRGSRSTGFLRSEGLRTLGYLSYGIYLWHTIILRWIDLRAESATVPPEAVSAFQEFLFVEYVAATIGCAALTYGLLEHPFLVLKARLFSRGSPATRSGAAWRAHWLPALILSAAVVLFAELAFPFGALIRPTSAPAGLLANALLGTTLALVVAITLYAIVRRWPAFAHDSAPEAGASTRSWPRVGLVHAPPVLAIALPMALLVLLSSLVAAR